MEWLKSNLLIHYLIPGLLVSLSSGFLVSSLEPSFGQYIFGYMGWPVLVLIGYIIGITLWEKGYELNMAEYRKIRYEYIEEQLKINSLNNRLKRVIVEYGLNPEDFKPYSNNEGRSVEMEHELPSSRCGLSNCWSHTLGFICGLLRLLLREGSYKAKNENNGSDINMLYRTLKGLVYSRSAPEAIYLVQEAENQARLVISCNLAWPISLAFMFISILSIGIRTISANNFFSLIDARLIICGVFVVSTLLYLVFTVTCGLKKGTKTRQKALARAVFFSAMFLDTSKATKNFQNRNSFPKGRE